jgi:tetratricopeptide (TPR) repeat protein
MSAAERAPERPVRRALELGLCALLVLSVAALYGQTARHEFVSYDDGSYVTENPHLLGGLSARNVRAAFTEFRSANWHPLTWLSHQLDVELFGLAPGPHHLVSAGLHALNAVLCFAFFRRATGGVGTGFLVALLFAVHPLRVESVAWVSERKDVLSGTFFFLTLLAHERHARAPSAPRYALVALCLALGLLAKPMLVTVPLVLLLLDAWPLGRLRSGRSLRGLLLEKLPLLALAGASAVVTLLAQRAGGAVQSLGVLSLPERLATAVHGVLAYLAQTFWPAGLAFFYPHPALVARAEFEPLGPRVVAGVLFLALVTFLGWRLRARFPALWVGWAWMWCMLLPVLGLIQVGNQFHADRYAYLPLLGPTFALVFCAREVLTDRRWQRAALGLGLALAVLLAVVAQRQVGTWKDSRTLCERALRVTERNHVAHEHLGLHLQRRGELERAEEQYRLALAIDPRTPSTHGNLGAIHAQRGRRAEAVAEFQEALRLVPDFLPARMSLGWLHEQEQDFEAAAWHYEIATRQHPESAAAWERLHTVLAALGRHDEARVAERRSAEAGAR